MLKALSLRSPRASRSARIVFTSLLIMAAICVPGGWTMPQTLSTATGDEAFLASAVLRPVAVNGQHGILLWLHTDPAFARKLRPSVTIPDLVEGTIQPDFVAIQGHGEVFRGEHYLLVEGVHQWVKTSEFVGEVRKWLGYDAQVLLLACNPDGVRIDIPNTIYWKDNLVDVTYGYGPWVMGKYIVDDPDNGRQAPLKGHEKAVAAAAASDHIAQAMDKLYLAIGSQEPPPVS